MRLPKKIATIKLMPFTIKGFYGEEEPIKSNDEVKKDVRRYFKKELVESDGVLAYKHSLGDKGAGTLLLFYFEKEIVAHAIYEKTEKSNDVIYPYNIYVLKNTVTYIENETVRKEIKKMFQVLRAYPSPSYLDERKYEDYLKLIKNKKSIVDEDSQEQDEEDDERVVNDYSSKQNITVYSRNMEIREKALKRAKGICDFCLQPAPFNKKDGQAYLESHHIKYRSKGGQDTLKNLVALCPNCHRKMHVLEVQKDIEVLMKKARNYKNGENLDRQNENS